MHRRNPSASAVGQWPGGGSSVRRRSGGATAFKGRAERTSVPVDESFPSVRSLPSLAAPNDDPAHIGEFPTHLPRQKLNGGVVNRHYEVAGDGYHTYPNPQNFNDTDDYELDRDSHFVNVNLNATRHNDNSGRIVSDNRPDYIGSIGTGTDDFSSNNYYGMKSPGSNETSHVTLASSVDSGHGGLIASVGTTNKFTHRWPRPKTFKDVHVLPKGFKGNLREDMGPNFSGVTALEQGKGVGTSYLARWTIFKWCLLISVLTVFGYGCAGLISALMTWFNAWEQAEVLTVTDNDILILLTLAGTLTLVTACIGIAGTLLNSRPVLAAYTFLLWPCLLSILSVGYTSYRRAHLSLDHKLNFSWSRYYTVLGRRIIQDALGCCGYYSSMHEASPSKGCYLRTPLPGCKAKLFDFERTTLRAIWRTIFSVAPLHILNILVALLCANHVTYVWGKRVMPKQYRLTPNDVKADAEKLLSGSMYIGEGLDEQMAHLHKS